MDYLGAQSVFNMEFAQNYINGKFESTEHYIDSYDPSVGQVWAKIPDSGSEEVNRAVAAAEAAFPLWSKLSVKKRAEYLLKAAQLLEDRLQQFAEYESKDQGKTVSLAASMDIPRAILNLRSFAESYGHLVDRSQSLMNDSGTLNYTIRTPIGVAALISPWNLPLYLLTFKLGPALITGNTVVCKPSELTSYTTWMLCKLFDEVQLPKGVLNLVCGYGNKAGQALVTDPRVRIISFTGSTAVGKHIAALAAPKMKHLSLELGGKNAALVFEDADLEAAIPTLLRSSFLNQGEICLCTSRIFVHKSIFQTFLDRFVSEVKKLKVGHPKDPDAFMGALVSKEHKAKVQFYLDQAVKDGGHIHCEQNEALLPNKEGYYILPTVISGLSDQSICMQDEIFGPVVCVSSFEQEQEVIDRANQVQYGLCASVWSENAGRLHRVAHHLQVGTVWQNCWLIRNLDMPFGGVKMSGIGREGTSDSIDTYTDVKTVCIKVVK